MLVYTEQKGRRRAVKTHELPVLPALRASIDATPVGHLVYLTTPEGKPYALKSLGQWFVDRCKEAGLPKGLSAHGLRKCAAIRAAEGGATEHELMALFGWTTSKEAGRYTRRVNRARLEAGAASLLAPRPRDGEERYGNNRPPEGPKKGKNYTQRRGR